MRIIAISHSAILDINRRLFVDLAERGHQVLLVCPSHWKNDFGDRPLRSQPLSTTVDGHLELRTIRINMAGNTALQCYLPLDVLALTRWRPDVVFIDEEPWSLAALQWTLLARLARCPFVVRTNENRLRTYPWPFSSIYASVLRHAACITPVNAYGIDILEKQHYTGKISLLPYAVDTNLFHPDDARVPDDGSLHLGFVGRIAPEKGLETLLHAVASLKDRPVTHIYGTGQDDYLARLYQLQRDLALPDSTIRWHGALAHNRVPEAMRSLDALVVPTVAYNGYKEQFGRVVIEALVSRVPVLTSDNGELPLLIEKTGGGFVFPEGDARRLADCIKAAMADRRTLQNLAKSGCAYVHAHYTYKVLADQVEVILQSSVNDHNAGTRARRAMRAA